MTEKSESTKKKSNSLNNKSKAFDISMVGQYQENNLDSMKKEVYKEEHCTEPTIGLNESLTLKKVSSTISAKELEHQLSQKSSKGGKTVSPSLEKVKTKKKMARINVKDLEIQAKQAKKKAELDQKENLHSLKMNRINVRELEMKADMAMFERLEERIEAFGEHLEENVNRYDYSMEIQSISETKLKNPFTEPFKVKVSDLEANVYNFPS